MFRKAILFLGVALGLSSAANAQLKCGTTEVYLKLKQKFPQIAIDEAALEQQIQSGMLNMAHLSGTANKGTATGGVDTTTVYHIPVVFHIIHEYGAEYVSDDVIYNEVAGMNRAYSRTNTSELVGLVPPYNVKIPGTAITYAGNAKIVFHLAQKDPSGQPTNGITRRYSYQASIAGDEAKYDIWAPNKYLNIWIIRKFNSSHDGAAAYAYQPFTAQSVPYGDGPIGISDYLNRDNTFAHEVGHYFNLAHPWGNTNSPEVACGDDGVDDTPITKGHLVDNRVGGCNYPDPNPNADIYDTTCASGYARTYTRTQYFNLFGEDESKFLLDTTIHLTFVPGTSPLRDTFIVFTGGRYVNDTIPIKYVANPSRYRDTVLKYGGAQFTTNTTINYPDTTNAQNIMDYTYCSKMFTYGQVVRMRAALNSPIGNRNNLWTFANLYATGIGRSAADTVFTPAVKQDLVPVADFSVSKNFFCANTTLGTNSITLTDRSWRDTISGRTWTVANGTTSSNTAATTQLVTVTQPGWVNISLTANSNAGSGSITRSDLVYAADPNAISPNGYFQEFESNGDLDKYPVFNYYGLNAYRWEVRSDVGYYDHSSIMFHNYDPRGFPTDATQTQTPGGNYSDFYTRAFDLSSSDFSSRANLTFYSSGASRTVSQIYMNDSLVVSYSNDCGNNWRTLTTLKGAAVANNGYVPFAYTPTTQQEWKLNGALIPAGAKVARVYFRFRYYSGTDNGEQYGYSFGTGNNFYLDRINITSNAVGVNEAELAAKGMTLAPNPTSGAATVTISGGDNSVAQINVMDVTGKLVYHTESRLSNAVNQIEIPASNIAVRGMYMVHVIANGKAQTQKLVVY